jgi:hypothetical protein
MRYFVALLLVAAVFTGGYYFGVANGSYRASPQQQGPFIVVYGTKNDSDTQKFIKDLDQFKIAYEFENLDKQSTMEALVRRMISAGMPTSGTFNTPVVDVGGQILISPDARKVVELYLVEFKKYDEQQKAAGAHPVR